MYKYILIILLLVGSVTFGDIITPISGGAGGADTDSIKGVPVQDTTSNLSDDDVLRYDVGSNTWLYEAPPGASGGEANTLADTGTFNGTTGFGLAGGKTGVALKVKGLIEGSNITIVASGDSAYSIAAAAASVADQSIKGDHIDSTAENIVFDNAYEGTSAEADSQYSTHNWVQVEIEDSLNGYMENDGDTVTGTYNFSDNPLEAITIIDFDDDISTPSYQEGRIFYDPTDNTLSVYNNEADITLNVGQEGWVYARNISGSTILDGKVVYITGAVSSRPTIELAQADVEATCKLIGVATHDIETATNGYVTLWGTVHGINLSDFSDGDEVYLSATVAGSLTTVAPIAPNCVVEVGHVIDGSANGDLLVLTGKLKTLNMLNDVLISGSPPASGDILVYDGTVWADTAVLQNYLLLSGGTMTGTINQSIYPFFADTIIIGADTLVSEDIPAHELRMIVRNASGVTLPKGTPVYISGATGNMPNIDSARADNAAMMPARGMVQADIANGSNGHIVVAGGIQKLNTTSFSVGDELYIGATGGVTITKPTGTNLIQKIGEVTRINASNGEIEIGGAGRTNDLPNIASANFWVGNGSGVPTAIVMSVDATMDNAGAVTVTDDSHDHIYSNIDETTSSNWASRVSDETGTGAWVFSIAPSFTLVPLFDSAQFDGNVDMDSLDVNGAADFTGTVTVGTVAGAVDMGGATSLEIPNSDNPTTDANGEIAQDNNGNALEFYIPSEGESGLKSFYEYKTVGIPLPDSVQAYIPDYKMFRVKDLWAPYGIEIDSIEIQLDADAAYSLVIEEWSGADPPVFQSTITTIATGASDTHAIEVPDTDAAIDANDWIVLDLPTTDVPFLNVGIYYHITEGN